MLPSFIRFISELRLSNCLYPPPGHADGPTMPWMLTAKGRDMRGDVLGLEKSERSGEPDEGRELGSFPQISQIIADLGHFPRRSLRFGG